MYPVSQVTVLVCPVVPVILPVAVLSELAILPVAVHVLAVQANVLNLPLVPQVAVPPPE